MKGYFVALAGDVLLGRGRSPDRAGSAAVAALLAAYSAADEVVERRMQVPLMVQEVGRDVWQSAPGKPEDVYQAALAVLRAHGLLPPPPVLH